MHVSLYTPATAAERITASWDGSDNGGFVTICKERDGRPVASVTLHTPTLDGAERIAREIDRAFAGCGDRAADKHPQLPLAHFAV